MEVLKVRGVEVLAAQVVQQEVIIATTVEVPLAAQQVVTMKVKGVQVQPEASTATVLLAVTEVVSVPQCNFYEL